MHFIAYPGLQKHNQGLQDCMMPVLGTVHCRCLEKWPHSHLFLLFSCWEVLTLVGIGILAQKIQQGWIPVGNNGLVLMVGHLHCFTPEGTTAFYIPAGEP